jgi:hypothetical protein
VAFLSGDVFFAPSLLNCEAITPSETATISGNSAATISSPNFSQQRDGVATRSNRAKVTAALLR